MSVRRGRFTPNHPGAVDLPVDRIVCYCTTMSALDDLIPLSPSMFHILLSLGEGERHGYALKREIAKRTNGAASR